MNKLPEQFLKQMQSILTDDYDSFLASYDQPSFNGLRVNTNKISVEEFLKISPFKLAPVPWCPEGFYYDVNDKVSQHPYYRAGLYYLQEPSAMAPAAFLPVKEGMLVLDGCSAPGGKGTQLAAKLKGTGLLVSNDVSFSRQKATLRNFELAGIRNSYVIAADLPQLDKFKGYFDAILLDAPCSGEGMFRKDPSLIKSWLAKGPDYYAPIQKKLIVEASDLLAEGGYLMYSTCTFSPAENEEVISHLLKERAQMHTVKLEKGSELFSEGYLPNTYHLYPHHLNGEGHFLTLLQKEGTRTDKASGVINAKKPVNNDFLDFLKNMKPLGGNYTQINDSIYLLPVDTISTAGIHTLRSGLLMGTIERDRFQPSQALALSLRKDEFNNVVDFKADDPNVMKYLKGETIEQVKATGWVLVCVDGYPLGFAKGTGNRLKNMIDKGYRLT